MGTMVKPESTSRGAMNVSVPGPDGAATALLSNA